MTDDSNGQETRTIEREFPIEEVLNGKTREETSLSDEEVENFIEWTKNIERSEALREAAVDRLDESELPQADSLLWIDHAEVYALCADCYAQDKRHAWSGHTRNEDYQELKAKMETRLENGTPCSYCRDDRIKALKEELEDEIDVEVVVLE